MELDATCALIVLDVQNAIDEPEIGELSNPDYIMRIQDLLSIWRARSWPVFHVKHHAPELTSPYHPLNAAHGFKEQANPLPGETVVNKEHSCAFINTGLGSMLRMDGCEKLMVCGVRTHLSVDATIRHAKALGFETYLLSDATAATAVTDPTGKEWPASYVQRLSLGVLDHSYCKVVSMSDLFGAL